MFLFLSDDAVEPPLASSREGSNDDSSYSAYSPSLSLEARDDLRLSTDTRSERL